MDVPSYFYLFVKDLYISILCVCVFFLHVCLCTVCMTGIHRAFLRPQVTDSVSFHVDVGDQ